jgi:hypothetical protein
MLIRCVCWFVLAAVSIGGQAYGQEKRVYLSPDDHTDYFWSADEETYRQAFLNTIDYYLDLAAQTAGNPSDFQSRWSCDGSLWMWTYEKGRSQTQFQRLVDRIADGHISVPLNPLAIAQGCAPTESVLRGMYYPGRIERQYGVRFRLAYMIENQTQPYGLTSLWAGAGAKYSWKGICDCDTLVPAAWDREDDIYRAVGPDGSSLLMKWNSMLWGNQGMGGYAEARYPSATVDQVTSNAPFNGFMDRYPYDVIGCFGKGWDDVQTQTDEFITVAMQKTDATRRVIVSNEEDFFRDFEATYDVGTLPAHACSFGNEWELYVASLAEVSARVKRAVEKLRAAEAMAAIVSQFVPSFMSGREAVREQAWMNLGLFYEHDFGMVGPPTGETGVAARIAWQRRLADEIDAYVNALHDDAAAALADLIPMGGPYTRFFVFNPLGWSRSDVADLPWTAGGPVHVVDAATQVEMPSQVVSIDGNTYLRVFVENMPSVGYRVCEILPGAGATYPDAATVSSGGSGPQTLSYQVAADDRDATSLYVGQPTHEVRVSGYNSGDRRDYVSADSEQESAAMEFAIDLPADATIQEAYLTVRAGPYSYPSPTGGMAIRLYDVADAGPFTNGLQGDLLNLYPTLPTTISWPAPSWPSGSDQTSPNLAALVQAFIDRSDYAPGQHIGFVVSEGTIETNRYYGWADFAAGAATAPKLTVVYTDPNGPPTGDALVIENARYRVTVAQRGAVTSLIDKTRGDREFAMAAGGRFINDLGASTGTLTVENAGPVSVSVKAVASSPLAHVSRITLYGGVDRIDIQNDITQNFDATQTWGFAFNLPAPDVRHEEVAAIINAKLTTAGGDYSPRNARYDWLTINHFADVSANGDVGVTLSNADCYFMKLGNSSVGVLDTVTPVVSVLVGGRVANGNNGLPAQGGDDHFRQRFALRTHDAYDPAVAMKTAMEHQTPFVARVVSGASPRLPATIHSAVSVSNPNVLLWAVKPAEEGQDHGIVARLWNLAQSPQSASVQLSPLPIVAAAQTTHIETDEDVVSVDTAGIHPLFGQQQLRTFRLFAAKRGDVNGDGIVNTDDILPFVAVLLGQSGNPLQIAAADVDGSGTADGQDIQLFVNALLSL